MVNRRFILISAGFLTFIILTFYFANYLNNNQGVITAIGLFLIIPTTIICDRIVTWLKKEQAEDNLKKMLLKELWINLNYVSAIENAYQENFSDSNVHYAHYPPRTHVLGKIIDFNLLGSLKERDKNGLIEIYEQLESLKYEYYLWRELMLKGTVHSDKNLYKIISSTMISYVDPVMRNMLKVWIELVIKYGAECDIPQITNINKTLKEKKSSGKWITTSYRSSFYKESKDESFNTILCWMNDWPECEKEVLEIKEVARIFKSKDQ